MRTMTVRFGNDFVKFRAHKIDIFTKHIEVIINGETCVFSRTWEKIELISGIPPALILTKIIDHIDNYFAICNPETAKRAQERREFIEHLQQLDNAQ